MSTLQELIADFKQLDNDYREYEVYNNRTCIHIDTTRSAFRQLCNKYQLPIKERGAGSYSAETDVVRLMYHYSRCTLSYDSCNKAT